MIIQKLKDIVEKNKNNIGSLFLRTVLKEELQNYTLNFIYNDSHYKKLIFTGGTCLRKVYGLPRLSEDLDFDFTETFNIEDFSQEVKKYFTKNLQYKKIETKISGNGNTLFLKFPILQEIGLAKSASDAATLFVRCDFSMETGKAFEIEVNPISTQDFTFYALSYSLSTLFANKIIAFLSRDFFRGSHQIVPFKGRGIFDLVWFIEQSAKREFTLQPYWKRIFAKLPIKTKEEVIQEIQNKVKKIDKKVVYSDLLPFIESADTLQNFTDTFAAIIENKLMYLK